MLGALFRSSTTTKRKTNLLLILTPYVIRDQDDLRKIFERKMQERQEFLDRYFVFNDSEWTAAARLLAHQRPGRGHSPVVRRHRRNEQLLEARERAERAKTHAAERAARAAGATWRVRRAGGADAAPRPRRQRARRRPPARRRRPAPSRQPHRRLATASQAAPRAAGAVDQSTRSRAASQVRPRSAAQRRPWSESESMQEQRALGEILVRRGVVAAEALEPLFAVQREKGGRAASICVVQNAGHRRGRRAGARRRVRPAVHRSASTSMRSL